MDHLPSSSLPRQDDHCAHFCPVLLFSVHAHTAERDRCLQLYCSGEFTDLQSHTDCQTVWNTYWWFSLSHSGCFHIVTAHFSSLSLIECIASAVCFASFQRVSNSRYAASVWICTACVDMRRVWRISSRLCVKQWGGDLLIVLLDFSVSCTSLFQYMV